MKGITTILAAVDGSSNSRRALEVALNLAEVAQASLTVLQVREFVDGRLAFYGSYRKGEPAGPPPALNVTEFCPRLNDTQVDWHAVDEVGHPADKICELAQKTPFDLVVVGSRGASTLSRFFLGSVSDRVIHHSGTNVLLVR